MGRMRSSSPASRSPSRRSSRSWRRSSSTTSSSVSGCCCSTRTSTAASSAPPASWRTHPALPRRSPRPCSGRAGCLDPALVFARDRAPAARLPRIPPAPGRAARARRLRDGLVVLAAHPRTLRSTLRIAFALLAVSFLVHVAAPSSASSLDDQRHTWEYQIRGMIKHGASLTGWTCSRAASPRWPLRRGTSRTAVLPVESPESLHIRADIAIRCERGSCHRGGRQNGKHCGTTFDADLRSAPRGCQLWSKCSSATASRSWQRP